MQRSTWTRALLAAPAALVVALLLLPGVSAATPASGATAAIGANQTQWAYGVQKNLSFTTTSNGTTYNVTGSFDYAVVFTQTNYTASSFQLEVQRTIGFTLTATYAGLYATAKLTAKGYENDTGFANFTTNGTVYVNGTAVPAVADENQSHTTVAGYVQSWTVTLGKHTASGHLDATLASQGHTTFSPAMGILPDNVTAGMSWNSSTYFDHVGTVQGAYNSTRTRLNGVTTTSNGSLNANDGLAGSEPVYGTDVGSVTLANGLSGQQIVLTTVGPLQPRDGVLWTTSGTDLFQNNKLVGGAFGLISLQTDRLDWVPHSHGHLGIAASETGFGPAPDANSVAGQSVTTQASTLSSGASPAQSGSPASEGIQAEPMAVPQAQAIQNCVGSTQGACGTVLNGNSPGSTTLGHFPIGIVVIAGVGAIAVIAGLLVVGRRRTPKYPTRTTVGYASASSMSAPAPPPRAPSSPPANPEEPDPLGRIW
jgi:hypothetical protein